MLSSGSRNFSLIKIACSTRPLAPLPIIERPTPGFWPESTPLFEEEGNLGIDAQIAYRARPFEVHGSRARSAFAADDDPVDAGEIEGLDRSDEGFDGKEANFGHRLAEMAHAGEFRAVLDRRAEPDVRGGAVIWVACIDVAAHQR